MVSAVSPADHPVGRISLPGTTLRLFDLGGQRDIRSIWPKYYDECHAVVFVLDAMDQVRLGETWEVFGEQCVAHAHYRRAPADGDI